MAIAGYQILSQTFTHDKIKPGFQVFCDWWCRKIDVFYELLLYTAPVTLMTWFCTRNPLMTCHCSSIDLPMWL
jgi:hypothetical protein